jgi:hypothetical protein
MSYRNLEVWQIARDLSIKIHRMTLEKLPRIEMYEEGPQIRRSMKSVRSNIDSFVKSGFCVPPPLAGGGRGRGFCERINIVDGYGRRQYKQDFLRFLVYAHASCDETTDHLEILYETQSLTDKALYEELHQQLETLGRKLSHFLSGVEAHHQSVREESPEYGVPKDE